MKKLIALLLALVMVLSMAACGASEDKPADTEAPTETSAPDTADTSETSAPDTTDATDTSETSAPDTTDPTETVTGDTDATEQDPTHEPLGETPALQVIMDFRDKVASAASMEDLANTLVMNENMPFMGAAMAVEPGFLNGFTAEITGFEEGAMFSPMIGAIPFVGYVFRLADDADANAFVDSLREKADLRWNICTAADEMQYDVAGNVVCFVMAPATFEE